MIEIDKKRPTKKKTKIKIVPVGVVIALVITVIGGTIYFSQNKGTQNNNSTNNNNSAQPEQQNNGSENQTPNTEKPETPTPTPNKPDAEKPKTDTPVPPISKDAPKLSIDVANKITIGMATNDVKSTIGAKNFDDALKSGGNLTALTLNIPGTNGGVIIGFDEDKVHSITRTYQLKENTKDSFKVINKGMAMSDVKAKLGMPATENGKKGTVVFVYKYNEGGELKEAVIAFDENDKVLVVS